MKSRILIILSMFIVISGCLNLMYTHQGAQDYEFAEKYTKAGDWENARKYYYRKENGASPRHRTFEALLQNNTKE